MGVRATVRGSRLIVDQATDLAEGTVLNLVADDEGDELDSEERQALDNAISRSLDQASKNLTAPADAILGKLRARRRG
jgi:hypothetical protein